MKTYKSTIGILGKVFTVTTVAESNEAHALEMRRALELINKKTYAPVSRNYRKGVAEMSSLDWINLFEKEGITITLGDSYMKYSEMITRLSKGLSKSNSIMVNLTCSKRLEYVTEKLKSFGHSVESIQISRRSFLLTSLN